MIYLYQGYLHASFSIPPKFIRFKDVDNMADTDRKDKKNFMELYIDYLQERLFKHLETISLLINNKTSNDLD